MQFDFAQYARERRRRQRRDGILLLLAGPAFGACAAFIWFVVGSPWFGMAGIAFSVALVAGGALTLTEDGPDSFARRAVGILGCLAFAATGALMIVTSLLDPDSFGWRGGGAGLIAGVLAVGFFGTGAILLVVREIRRWLASP